MDCMLGQHTGPKVDRKRSENMNSACICLFAQYISFFKFDNSQGHLKRSKFLQWTFSFLFSHWQSCFGLYVFYFVLMSETTCLHFNSQPLPIFAVQFLNGIGDLLDLIPALKRRSNSSSDSFRMPGMSHCSALIKVRSKMMPSPHDSIHIFYIGWN